jgi:Uma2 family endonuclease
LRLFWNIPGRAAEASMELGFRARPDFEYWIADVAVISRERWRAIPKDGNLQGVPDLVVEVLSPSNTAWEIFDKEQVCLANGAREFWVVDPVREVVRVSGIDGPARTYGQGQSIAVLFGGEVGVDSIFAEDE